MARVVMARRIPSLLEVVTPALDGGGFMQRLLRAFRPLGDDKGRVADSHLASCHKLSFTWSRIDSETCAPRHARRPVQGTMGSSARRRAPGKPQACAHHRASVVGARSVLFGAPPPPPPISLQSALDRLQNSGRCDQAMRSGVLLLRTATCGVAWAQRGDIGRLVGCSGPSQRMCGAQVQAGLCGAIWPLHRGLRHGRHCLSFVGCSRPSYAGRLVCSERYGSAIAHEGGWRRGRTWGTRDGLRLYQPSDVCMAFAVLSNGAAPFGTASRCVQRQL